MCTNLRSLEEGHYKNVKKTNNKCLTLSFLEEKVGLKYHKKGRDSLKVAYCFHTCANHFAACICTPTPNDHY